MIEWQIAYIEKQGTMSWQLRVRILLIVLCTCGRGYFAKAQIYVQPDQAANALAKKLAGQGVTISNATLNCAGQASGFFNVVSSNIGLDSGVVLTTGLAATTTSAYGVNGLSGYLASNDNSFPGDGALNVLAGQPTVDACDLEFDVIPNGDSIKFKYVFSSEEYKNAVCGPYNDAFAFFISGPGIVAAENMALVPGTNIPVTINSINNGVPGPVGVISNCTNMGAGSPFTSYYIDNSSGTTLTHQGLTAVLEARHKVIPCSNYHLKIVIADAGDPLYDSGVFLEAGSLQTGTFNINAIAQVPEDASAAFCIKGCLSGRFRIMRSEVSNEPKTVKFVFGGTAVSGVDYAAIADSLVIPMNEASADVAINGLATPVLGTKTLQIFIRSPFSCSGTNSIVDSATLLIYDTLSVRIVSPDTVVCDGDNVPLRITGDDFLSYQWTPESGLNNADIMDPIATPDTNTTYVVSASLPGTLCPVKTASVGVHVKLSPHLELIEDTTICFNTQMQLVAGTMQSNLFYSYLWAGPGGFTSSIADPVISNVTSKTTGVYTVVVRIDTNNCSASASTNITVNTPDTPNVVTTQIFCLNKPADSLKGEGVNLRWYETTADTGSYFAPVPPTNEPGIYSYSVTQTIGNCESPKTTVEVEVKKCCDGNIFIPNAFTPNGDGRNDKFEAIMDYGYRINSMYIFNRWGQIVFSGLDGIWDGSFDGKQCEIGSYFYRISFGCILGGEVERTGDITLVR